MDPAEQSILDTIVVILSILIPSGGLVGVIVLLWKIYIHQEAKFSKELEDEKSLQNHHLKFKRLSSRKYRSRYTARLRWSLGALSRFFGPHAFSAKSYEVCLTWAFIYPIILGFLFFLITNQDISGFGVFPPIEEGRFWKAPLIAIVMVGIIYSIYKAATEEDRLKSLVWLAFAGASFFAFTGAGAFVSAGAVASVGAFAVVGTGAGAISVAFAGTFAFVVAAAGTVTGIVASIIAGIFVVVILIIYRRFSEKGHFFLFYILYFLFVAGFICLFLEQSWLVINLDSFGILLFLVILPMINSVFDWASLGLTRYLLKKSLKSFELKKALYYLVDFFLALFSLLFLIGTLFFVIKAMTADRSIYDLDAFLKRLQSQSLWQAFLSPDGWVVIMIFSTFVPSLVHGLAFGGYLLTITRPDPSKITRFSLVTAPDYILALKEKNEISGYLARQSIANFVFPTIGVLLLAGVILAVLPFFGDIVTWLISR